MKFCPTCRYYMYLKTTAAKREVNEGQDTSEEGGPQYDIVPATFSRICHNCGYQENDTEGGLVMETDLQEKTSEGYKILLNEFTKKDPTLPHITTVKCPNEACRSNTAGVPRDVIYMKYDSVNLKFLYLCNIEGCNAQWRSKGS